MDLIPKLVASKEQQCVVFPLCGEILDMKAVLDTGHRVIGIEGCSKAIELFFTQNKIPFQTEKDESNEYDIYKGTNHPITIYCTDFLTFNKSLPRIDYIWDRRALVAINPLEREKYRDSLLRMMTPLHTQLFLVAVFYDDPNYVAPPYPLTDEEVNELFGSHCSIKLLQVFDLTKEFNSYPVAHQIRYIEDRIHLIVQQ